jgi:hypothetical protein
MTYDFGAFLKLMIPLITAVANNLPAGSPPYLSALLSLALGVLGRFSGPYQHYGVSPGDPIPPESEWTPEGLTRWAQLRVSGSDMRGV